MGLRSPLDRPIARLAIPALGALVAEPVYVLTDTAIVGRVGTDELGGLAVASAVLLTVNSLMIFLAYGTTGAVGRHLGAGNQSAAAHLGVQGLWLGAGVGLLIGMAGVPLVGPLVAVFGAEAAVVPFAEQYLRISLVGLAPLLMVLAGTGYLRGIQDTRTPLLVALVSVLANLVIELWFVFGLDMGVAGSAWSTVIAQWGAALAYVAVVATHARRQAVSMAPSAPALISLGRTSGDLVMRTAALRATLLITTVMAARSGTVALAAHEIALGIWFLTVMILDALAIAGQALVARFLGAGSVEQARLVARRLIELSLPLGAVLGLALAASGSLVPAAFTDDPAVRSLTGELLWWLVLLQPVAALVFVLDGVLIGAGDLRFLARAMLMGAVPGIAVTVTAGAVGIHGVWAGLAVFMVARVLPLLARYRGPHWAVTGAAAPR